MIPHRHDSIVVDSLDESHRPLLQYVRRSDVIKLQETQQQQQQTYLHLLHPSYQQPFVANDMQFQQPFSTNQQAPSFNISRFTTPFQSSQSASPKSDLQRRISILWQLYPATYVQWPLLPLLQQPLASSTHQWPCPLSLRYSRRRLWHLPLPSCLMRMWTWTLLKREVRVTRARTINLSSHHISLGPFQGPQVLQKWVLQLRWQISVQCSNPSSKPK